MTAKFYKTEASFAFTSIYFYFDDILKHRYFFSFIVLSTLQMRNCLRTHVRILKRKEELLLS